MFPNEYNMPFYSTYGVPNTGFGLGAGLRGVNAVPRTGGLFSRLFGGSNAIRAGVGGARTINWSGLLNNASKTLNVINQAIPVVKQVGPMYNNMKSMLKVASLFKDETDPVSNNNSNNKNSNSNDNEKKKEKENTIINSNYSNSPNFFI